MLEMQRILCDLKWLSGVESTAVLCIIIILYKEEKRIKFIYVLIIIYVTCYTGIMMFLEKFSF